MNLFSRSIRFLFICSVVVLSTVLLGLLAFINAYQLSENMETELKAMLTAKSGEIFLLYHFGNFVLALLLESGIAHTQCFIYDKYIGIGIDIDGKSQSYSHT